MKKVVDDEDMSEITEISEFPLQTNGYGEITDNGEFFFNSVQFNGEVMKIFAKTEILEFIFDHMIENYMKIFKKDVYNI